MRGALAIGAAAGMLLWTAPAAADLFENQFGGDVVETSHAVRVTLDDGFARYRVRRTIRNDGEFTDEMSLSIDLPPGAAADGLRVRSRGRWHDGELMKADKALERFNELTDFERELPKGAKRAGRRPVLLQWEYGGSVTARVYPVEPNESVTFEYTMVAPTCWGNGRQYLQYPTSEMRQEFVEPLIAVTTAEHGGKVTLHSRSAPAIDGIVCGDGASSNAVTHTTIEIEPTPIQQAALRYGLYETSAGRYVARLDVDAAEVLEPVPKRARVVFVLDGSWSTGDERLAQQLELVRGYLSHVPDAEFEVVVFRRYAERLLGRFESAELFDQILPSIPSRKRYLGNGSNVEQGVALAANLLSAERGPARVVVFTDERTRKAYSNDLAIAAGSPLPRHAVLHVIDRGSPYGSMSEYRDDDAELAPLAAAFGGVLLRIGGEPTDPIAVASVMLGVVRPIRIDDFAIVAGGIEALEEMPTEDLNEGEGRRRLVVLDRAPKRVRVTGKIWGREWSRTVAPHAALSDAVPALVFGDEAHGALTEAEQLAAALQAGAVSSQTSYLAAEDRPVPVPENLATYGTMSVCGGSCCGSSCIGTRCGGAIGTGTGRHVEPPRYGDLLRAFMASTLDRCGRVAGVDEITAHMAVEATTTEIVDVTVEGDISEDLRECLVDGAWEIRLSSEFDSYHETYRAALHWAR